ncbi:ATP-dependent helicase HrpB [Alteromonas sp. H39]|uniref:ATP-dependent helicase HrpB n=1 Tax=Alteromonas sp. H39 TaxID=3389876 RepID=UPI0039E02F19
MLSDALKNLPAASLVPDLHRALERGNVIVGAPPGAGKSTVLPLSLLNRETTGRILLMQPRRVVVRNLASYLAEQRQEAVGESVGYRIRGESKVSQSTRLEIITEGILARMIQQDPELPDVQAIIFDEFHERSIHSDFGLALALEVQQGLREDLRIIVMSATLELDSVKSLLPDAECLFTEGRTFPVEVFYSGSVSAQLLHDQVARQIRQAVNQHKGDVLVFLSGRGAINRVAGLIDDLPSRMGVVIHRLLGSGGKESQLAAIRPDPEGRRKVILATNVAETSLTIEGVTVVIDSGMENQARFHPASGLTTLTEQRISQASAIQRAGRAGRVQAGICYRLWAQEAQSRMARHSDPQILREDVTSLLLEALCWGSKLLDLPMLTQPSQAQRDVAFDTLAALGAVDESGQVTRYGRALSAIPCHPKLANMLLEAARVADKVGGGQLREAAALVAAIAEAGLNTGNVLLHEALASLPESQKKPLYQQAKRYARYTNARENSLKHVASESMALACAIALAYPERLAYRRGETFKMASGKGARCASVVDTTWLAVLDGQQIGTEFQIRLAEKIDESAIKALFPDVFRVRQVVRFNPSNQKMEARQVTGVGDIDVTSEPVAKVPATAWSEAWTDYLSSLEVNKWPLDDVHWQWWFRVKLARDLQLEQPQAFDSPEPWPVSFEACLRRALESLQTKLTRCRQVDDLSTLPWLDALQQSLSWPQQHAISEALPTTLKAPSGHSHKLRYTEHGDVIYPVRMQEMYGQNATLMLAGGKVNIVLELLSPAHRPLQTTTDIGAFWRGSYREIQKEMKGRYPKHYWPDDPTTAVPTTKTKKAMG